jgi:hypothetical protein
LAIIERFSGFEHRTDGDPGGEPGRTTDMIAVRMTDDQQCQAVHSVTGKKWQHHALTSIPSLVGGACVDGNPSAARRTEQRRITLAHVEKM